jgi:predicted transcriptional regulator
MPAKRYKDYRFYSFVALNFLASFLDISIFQKDLLKILDPILENQNGVSKSAIMYEIKSNLNMTNKVISYLQEEALIEMEASKGEYNITINKQGILYLREYSRFYVSLFKKEIAELYRYGTVPAWVESDEI